MDEAAQNEMSWN